MPALACARVGSKLYMPSALLAAQLPVGFGVGRVPRLMEVEGEDEAARGSLAGLRGSVAAMKKAKAMLKWHQATLKRPKTLL